jgi:hypothetical protein
MEAATSEDPFIKEDHKEVDFAHIPEIFNIPVGYKVLIPKRKHGGLYKRRS